MTDVLLLFRALALALFIASAFLWVYSQKGMSGYDMRPAAWVLTGLSAGCWLTAIVIAAGWLR